MKFDDEGTIHDSEDFPLGHCMVPLIFLLNEFFIDDFHGEDLFWFREVYCCIFFRRA